jgi:hypothetical protein
MSDHFEMNNFFAELKRRGVYKVAGCLRRSVVAVGSSGVG